MDVAEEKAAAKAAAVLMLEVAEEAAATTAEAAKAAVPQVVEKEAKKQEIDISDKIAVASEGMGQERTEGAILAAEKAEETREAAARWPVKVVEVWDTM